MAKKKSKPDKKEYIAMTNLSGKGKDYLLGDTVQDGDFPPAVIANWVKRGHLLPVVEEGD